MSRNILLSASALMAAVALPLQAQAELFEYNTNEVQIQYGRYEIPFTGSNDQENGFVYTYQHASGWKYGDNFGFLDYTDLDDTGTDLYGEFYANFSLGKITGRNIGFWRVRDIGILAGVNYGRDTGILKYLPGVRFSWDIPGFAFLNTDFTAYIDANNGDVDKGEIPQEDDSYMIDINWAAPFTIGKQRFSIEGHVEYIDSRDNEFGDNVSWHVLGQPQFRWDAGNAWFGEQDKLFVGIEWQFWINKNGDSDTNESAPQLLAVWRF